MLGLTIHAHANRQFDSSLGGPLEKRQETVASGVACAVGVFVEVADLFLVDCDGKYFFLFEFIGVVFVALDDHEAVIFMEFNFGRNEEDLWEKVLFG